MAHLPGSQAQGGIWPQVNYGKRETATTNPWILEEENLSSTHTLPTLLLYQENIAANICCTRHQTLVTRKKNQIAFDQLRRTLQQLQTVTKITGATSLLWPHWCLGASTQSLRASVKISVSHTVGLLYRQGPKALGTSESSRLQEQLWSSGWEPHSWAQLTCPALPSAECHARWTSS